MRGAQNLLRDFEEIHNRTKHKADFREFIRESNLEDFASGPDAPILVSTIHQTKGREFDNVFLALSRFPEYGDEAKRSIYVAVTRAKQNLRIFCNAGYFDEIESGGVNRQHDGNVYPAPRLIIMQLLHKDVNLGYFAYRRRAINSLLSGQELAASDKGCFLGQTQVLKYSASFLKKMEGLKAKGYAPSKARVRHVVHWQNQETDEDVKIILPDVEFVKEGNHEIIR